MTATLRSPTGALAADRWLVAQRLDGGDKDLHAAIDLERGAIDDERLLETVVGEIEFELA